MTQQGLNGKQLGLFALNSQCGMFSLIAQFFQFHYPQIAQFQNFRYPLILMIPIQNQWR